jgi:hypothetical protein
MLGKWLGQGKVETTTSNTQQLAFICLYPMTFHLMVWQLHWTPELESCLWLILNLSINYRSLISYRRSRERSDPGQSIFIQGRENVITNCMIDHFFKWINVSLQGSINESLIKACNNLYSKIFNINYFNVLKWR